MGNWCGVISPLEVSRVLTLLITGDRAHLYKSWFKRQMSPTNGSFTLGPFTVVWKIAIPAAHLSSSQHAPGKEYVRSR